MNAEAIRLMRLDASLPGAGRTSALKLLIVLLVLSGQADEISDAQIHALWARRAQPSPDSRARSAALKAWYDFCDAQPRAAEVPTREELLDEQYQR